MSWKHVLRYHKLELVVAVTFVVAVLMMSMIIIMELLHFIGVL